ncbi:MAG: chorismate mutase, partial [Clostridia bacterium]
MKTLDDLRAEIDRIDSNMARLFTERMDCVRSISDCKTASCGSILNPEREMRVIDAFVNNAAPPLHSYATAFAKNMIRISREYQYSLQNERL